MLGRKLWDKQIEILEAVRDHRRTAVRSCFGAGKTHCAAIAALWWLYSYPRSLVVTTAPTHRQVEKALWKEIRAAHRDAKVPLGGDVLQTQIKIDADWMAFGFATDDPDAFQGLKATDILVIFDEAAGIAPTIWTAAESSLSIQHSRLLAIGNPTDPTGPFADEFQNPGTKKLAISAFETPNVVAEKDVIPGLVTREWIEERSRRWGEGSMLWKVRILGEFPDSASDSLIPLSWIEAAQRRELSPADPFELGVDVARYGDDATALYLRRGPVVRKVAVVHQQDTMQVTGLVVQALRSTRATQAHVDVVGIGSGVVDRLLEQGFPVHPVNVGERAYDAEKFANRRAEIFWALRERFESGEIDLDPADEELAAELSTLRFQVDSRGRIQIESKEDMKRRVPKLGSPDRGDAVAMAFSQPAFVMPDRIAISAAGRRASPWRI